MKITYTKEILEPIIKKSYNLKEVILSLGLSYANGSIKQVKEKIELYNLDITHFKKSRRGKSYTNSEIFKENSKVSRTGVRCRVLKEALIPYICQECGQDENWRGKKMPLILDHINGVNNDNRLKNLRFLCSNCDSTQPTYKSKNTGLSEKEKQIRKQLKEKEYIRRKKIKKEGRELRKKLNIQNWKNKILENNIDFSKKTWGVEVAKIMDKSPQYCLKFVKENLQYLMEG